MQTDLKRKQIQTNKRFKRTLIILIIMTIHDVQMLGVSPFLKRQNNSLWVKNKNAGYLSALGYGVLVSSVWKNVVRINTRYTKSTRGTSSNYN